MSINEPIYFSILFASAAENGDHGVSMLSESAFVFFFLLSRCFNAFTCRRFCLISFLYSSLTTINDECQDTHIHRKSIAVGARANLKDAGNDEDVFGCSLNGHLLLTVYNYTLFYGALTQLFIYN